MATKKRHGIRALYCVRCGLTQIVKGSIIRACEACQGLYFDRTKPAHAIDYNPANLSRADREWLRQTRIAAD